MSEHREMMYTINARWYLDHWSDGYEEDYEGEKKYATGFITGEYNIFVASQIIASQKLIDGMQGDSANYWLTPIGLEDPSPWMK